MRKSKKCVACRVAKPVKKIQPVQMNMTLTVVDLERQLDIALEILLNRYPEEIGAVHVS